MNSKNPIFISDRLKCFYIEALDSIGLINPLDPKSGYLKSELWLLTQHGVTNDVIVKSVFLIYAKINKLWEKATSNHIDPNYITSDLIDNINKDIFGADALMFKYFNKDFDRHYNVNHNNFTYEIFQGEIISDNYRSKNKDYEYVKYITKSGDEYTIKNPAGPILTNEEIKHLENDNVKKELEREENIVLNTLNIYENMDNSEISGFLDPIFISEQLRSFFKNAKLGHINPRDPKSERLFTKCSLLFDYGITNVAILNGLFCIYAKFNNLYLKSTGNHGIEVKDINYGILGADDLMYRYLSNTFYIARLQNITIDKDGNLNRSFDPNNFRYHDFAKLIHLNKRTKNGKINYIGYTEINPAGPAISSEELNLLKSSWVKTELEDQYKIIRDTLNIYKEIKKNIK